MPKTKLRPINETRGPHGQFTSETAFRLYCRKGGLARAAQQKADGYRVLNEARPKAIAVRRLKAKLNGRCTDCAVFAKSILALLAQMRPDTKAYQLDDPDRKLLL